MEDQRPPWEESKKDDDETSLPDPRSEGIFAILNRMRQEEMERNEEDDDEEEDTKTGKKKGRFRRFFGKLLGSKIAPVEKVKPATEKPDDDEASYASEVEQPKAAETSVAQASEAANPAIQIETDENEPELSLPEPERTEPYRPDRATESAAPAAELPEPLPPDFEPPIVPQLLYERGLSPQQVAEMSPPAREEVILDRRAALGPALVVGATVDQLSRRRDRKLKREDRSIRNEVEAVKNQATTQQEKNQRLETAANNTSNQLEAAKFQADRFEQRIRPVEQIIEKVEKPNIITPEKQERTQQKERIEKIEKRIEQGTPDLPEITPEVAPVVVLQEVEAAAERNAPIEDKLEKRHEIKDESRQPDFGATSVGHVLANLHKQTTQAHASFNRFAQTHRQDIAAQAPPVAYKQAARNGFWAGIVIAAVLIMIAIVA